LSELDQWITNKTLLDKIRGLLSNDTSIDYLKPLLHIPILLLHECKRTKAATSLTPEYKKSLIDYHKQRAEAYFKKQIQCLGDSIDKYSEITFHIILFPVPNKAKIVDSFIENVEHFKKQG
jgi:hypothetical protein